MSSGESGPAPVGPGRGGRGAALIQALNAPMRKPGEIHRHNYHSTRMKTITILRSLAYDQWVGEHCFYSRGQSLELLKILLYIITDMNSIIKTKLKHIEHYIPILITQKVLFMYAYLIFLFT